MSWLWQQIADCGWRYWAWVLGLTVVGVLLGHYASDAGFFITLRYGVHQFISGQLSPRPLNVRHTAVILIGDEEYWRGYPAGRRPIKRDYLAGLLLAVDRANPELIALDFDLSSPDPQSSTVLPEYQKETDTLVEAIRSVAARRAIVLPRTIGVNESGQYVLEADIYDGSRLCPMVRTDPRVANVSCGYIALPNDIRLLPPRLALANGVGLDSLALAVAGARMSVRPAATRGVAVNYGSFIPIERYQSERAVMSATAVFTQPEERRKLEHRVVFIGGAWSSQGYARGAVIDGHPSPVGMIPGVFVHANYVEAILDSRTYPPLPEWIGGIAEAVLVLAAAVVFAVRTAPWRKMIAVGLLVVGLAVFAYVLLQNLGRFFDASIPLMIVGGHAIVEQVREWRREAHRCRTEHGAWAHPE